MRYKASKRSYIRSVSEKAVICYKAGRHFILKFSIYCHFKPNEAGFFKSFFICLEMVDKMW